jgi:Mor family transcriptional regulator
MSRQPLRELLLDIIDRVAMKVGTPSPALVQRVYRDVIRSWGGQSVYIPRRDENEREMQLARDAEILRAYRRGEHVEYLARKHALSVSRVYQIIRDDDPALAALDRRTAKHDDLPH